MRTTTILCLVDVVGALASGSLQDHVYLMDDNTPPDAPRHATGTLATRVRAGDLLIWLDLQVDVETDTCLLAVWGMPPDICVPSPVVLEGTDVTYWQGTVLRDFTGSIPYWIDVSVEGVPMRPPATSTLFCGTTNPTGG